MCCPCTQFANQELPQVEDIHKFTLGKLANAEGCFIIMERVDVNGKNMHTMYRYLKQHSELYKESKKKALPIPWNFGKFLVDGQGNVLDFKGPTVSPLSMESRIWQAISSTCKGPSTN